MVNVSRSNMRPARAPSMGGPGATALGRLRMPLVDLRSKPFVSSVQLSLTAIGLNIRDGMARRDHACEAELRLRSSICSTLTPLRIHWVPSLMSTDDLAPWSDTGAKMIVFFPAE